MSYVLTVLYIIIGSDYQAKITTTAQYQSLEDCNLVKVAMTERLESTHGVLLKHVECTRE